MFEQNSYGNPTNVRNHFLVFVYGVKLSPLILNDKLNSFEVFSLSSTSEFISCFQSQRPGCLVTDAQIDFFNYPNLNLMSRLMPVVMVTNSSSVTAAAAAGRKGAHSVLRDFNNDDRVRDAIRSACFADTGGESSPFSMRCRINKLTSKERQVIYMSLRGKTTKMISGELGVCHQTVDKHKKRALSKLRSNGVVDLMNLLLDSHRLATGVGSPSVETRQSQAAPPRPHSEALKQQVQR